MSRTIFIGDVHGCLAELQALLEKVDPNLGDRVIFVGDLVDRGPNSLSTLRYARRLLMQLPGSVVVSGNHEEKSSRVAKTGKWVEPWCEEATESDWSFIDSMPLTWYDPKLNIRVVHGGIFPALLAKHPDIWEKIAARGDKFVRGSRALRQTVGRSGPMRTPLQRRRDTETRTIYGVWSEPDGSGFYAGAEYRSRIVWRSLTTRDEVKADRWAIQVRCHGASAHCKTCLDCEGSGA